MGAVSSELDIARRTRLWEILWPVLGDAALEFRWIANRSAFRCALLVRVAGDDETTSVEQIQDVASTVTTVMREVFPAVGIRPLGKQELGEDLDPFPIVEGGDMLRREIEVETASGYIDVPLPLIGDPVSGATLGLHMRSLGQPLMVSLAAGPTDIDLFESRLLDAELNELERARLAAVSGDAHDTRGGGMAVAREAEPASLRLATAEGALGHRIAFLQRLGFLRLSIASGDRMPTSFRALAQHGLGWAGGSLDYIPAAEPAERAFFARNLTTVGFEPWGQLVEEREERRTVSDCYLASLDEIAESAWFAPASVYSDSDVKVYEPAPKPVPGSVPTKGRPLGVSRYAYAEKPVALSEADLSRHSYIIGQTGTGKSTLLLKMAEADIKSGAGVCVIDPHGDLVDSLVCRIPKRRAEDLILFDPVDTEWPIAFNLFDAHGTMEQDFVIQQTIAMLYRLYDPGHTGIIGPRFEHWLRNASLTAMADPEGGTFLDVPKLFTDDAYLAKKLQWVVDPVVRSFWIGEMGQTSDFHKSEMLGWVISKWGAFMSNTMMRNILGQRRSAFRMREVMDQGKILLIKLPKGRIGEINATLLGMIFVSHLQMAALGRSDCRETERRRFSLYVDEFQSFALSSFDELIAEARKYGLALTLANQHVRQVPEKIRAAIFGNVGTLCAFRVGFDDAEMLAEQLLGYSATDLTRMENHRMIVRMAVDGRVQSPFDVFTLPASKVSSSAEELAAGLVALSRTTYGRDRATVDSELRDMWRVGTLAPPLGVAD